MTSSDGNFFRVTGPLFGEFTGPVEFPAQRPVTRSFDVFFDPRPNKRLSKQPWGWWFETPSWSLWRQCNAWIADRNATLQCHNIQNRSSPLSETVLLSRSDGMRRHYVNHLRHLTYLFRIKTKKTLNPCITGPFLQRSKTKGRPTPKRLY